MSLVGVEGARGRGGRTRFWGVKVGIVVEALEVKGKVLVISDRPSRPWGWESTAALRSSSLTLKPEFWRWLASLSDWRSLVASTG